MPQSSPKTPSRSRPTTRDTYGEKTPTPDHGSTNGYTHGEKTPPQSGSHPKVVVNQNRIANTAQARLVDESAGAPRIGSGDLALSVGWLADMMINRDCSVAANSNIFQRIGDEFHAGVIVLGNAVHRLERIEACEPDIAVLDQGADIVDGIGVEDERTAADLAEAERLLVAGSDR